MDKKTHRLLILILSIIMFFSAFASASFAYFSSDLKINGFVNVKIELLFERFEEDALNNYLQENGLVGNITSADEKWGHKGNPYLISEVRHLYNLSVLQNIGYFHSNFIGNNFDGENLVGNQDYSDGYDIPYFVIANPNGTPVVIDATGRVLNPIGTDEFPFIGSVTGVSDKNSSVSFNIDNGQRKTTTSAIHNVTIKTSKSSIDHGLFGVISYLGDESQKTVDQESGLEFFSGFASTISNILFSDIQVVVATSSTIWEDIAYWAEHLFYGQTFGVSGTTKDPCETNHLGIIAGHVEYAKMSAISVYYSSDEKIAIDLNDAGQKNNGDPLNYASSTGFVGFMYNLNPVVNTDGSITVGSGLDSADISYGFQGGGGLSSGVLPGYIRAEEMYDTYGYYAIAGEEGQTEYEKQTGDLYLIKAYDETGIPLANASGENYYYTDGVFTFALSGGQSLTDVNTLDTIEDIWKPDAKTGEVKVDNISITKDDWKIEKGKEGRYYFQPLELITDVNELKEGGTFYIGTRQDETSGDSTLYVMNLLSKGSSVPAEGRTVHLMNDDGKFGLMYESEDVCREDMQYAVKFNNVSEDVFNITLAQKNSAGKYNSLGVGVTDEVANTKAVSIYCGDKDNDTSFDGKIQIIFPIPVTYKVSYNIVAKYSGTAWTLTSNNTDGSQTNISFNLNGQDSSFVTDKFSSGGSTGSSEPIHIYRLSDLEEKRVAPYTYVPQGETIDLPANQYVFWPEVETSGDAKTTATTYEIKALSDINWTDNNGDRIWEIVDGNKPVINKMFNIKKTVNWKVAISLGNWNFSFGDDDEGGAILAPVGSGSYQKEIYVPTGSVAFYINKVPDGGAKIRVVVKVPQSTTVGGLNFDGGTNAQDHYLGLWRGTEKNQSSWLNYSSFDVDNAYKKVELPRSQKLISGEDANASTYNGVSSDTQKIVAYYNNNGVREQYTTMLQGGHYLLAYEFKVEETGTYILAATDVRMQLAYCSVDGVASSGRDGTGGSLLGNIDFVYDNGENVLLVTDGGTGGNGVEDPSKYYYESFVLMHFANRDDAGNLHAINSEVISIYRWAGGEGEIKTNIDVNVVSGYCSNNCEHVLCSPIKTTTDNINVTCTKKE